MDLCVCLTAAVGMTLAAFCRHSAALRDISLCNLCDLDIDLSRSPKIKCFLLSLIISPKLWKIESAPNDLKMTLNATRSKGPYICWTTSPKFHSVLFYDRLFTDNWGFWFLHRIQWWIWNFRKKIIKNRKLKISKIPNVIFMRTIGRKIEDKFEHFRLWFVGRVVFWHFHSHRDPC